MTFKGERTRGRVMVLLFITLLIVAGSGGYFYYIKHKEPTQGIFVYNQEIRREEIISGYLYQPS